MIAARHREPPDDLRLLRHLHAALPPAHAPYGTVDGQAFLVEFHRISAQATYTVRELATALGVAVQTIHNMKTYRIIRSPKKWPRDNDLRDLLAAWRIAKEKSPRRQDPEFAAVHQALIAVIERGFEFPEITQALGVPPRTLGRYLEEPLGSPTTLARAVFARVVAARDRPRQGM